MHQPTEPRKYQLFPTKDKLSIAGGHKTADAESSQSTTGTGENGTSEKDRSLLGSALRSKPKEQSIVRRRKASITDLGPMTTVQEIAMDSREYPVSLFLDIKLIRHLPSYNTRPTTTARAIH